MRSRMERYEKQENASTTRRSSKNQELYENIGRNTKYTNFTDVTNANAFDLGTAKKNYRTREGYHQMKEYNDFKPETKLKKELDDFNYIYQDHENKVYDINCVLAEAKKNRVQKDELEAKRKLKNTNYNILASLNPEELEKYGYEVRKEFLPEFQHYYIRKGFVYVELKIYENKGMVEISFDGNAFQSGIGLDIFVNYKNEAKFVLYYKDKCRYTEKIFF